MSEEFLSLFALAESNIDEVQAITSRVYPSGKYVVLGKKVEGSETEPKEEGQAPLIRFTFEEEVLKFTPIDKKVDPESMVGRTLKESLTIWPKDLVQSLGLLKGRYQKAGLPNQGMAVGGVAGKEPGWLDTMVNAQFVVKVRSYPDKTTGELRNAFDWEKYVPEGEEEAA